nr:integrase, catalytic region, zinc finger, CCHC-type, peptidase aspartic, catalytic [Tanacetum cinerariifolium]
MTGDRSQLRNFVKKFIGTVRFENDHFGAIMGYGDYVISDSVISRYTMWKDLDTISSLLGNFVILILKLHSGSIHVMFEIQMKLLLLLVTPKIDPQLTLFITKPHMSCKDLGKLQTTADIGIFVGYAPSQKGYRIYNKRT